MIVPNLLVAHDKCAFHDNELCVTAIIENEGYPLIIAACNEGCIQIFSPLHLEARYYVVDEHIKIEIMQDDYNNIPLPIIDYYTWVIYDVRRYRS